MKFKFISLALFALTIILELFFSNNPSDLFVAKEEHSIDLSNAIYSYNTTKDGSGINFNENGSTCQYKLKSPQPATNIYLQFQGDSKTIVTGEIRIKDENFSEQFQTLNKFQFNPKGANKVIVPVKSSGKLKEIEIALTDGVNNQPVVLCSATLNKNVGVQFNFVRWLFMALFLGCALLIKKFALTDKIFDPENIKHFAVISLIIIINTVIVLFIATQTNRKIDKDIKTTVKTDKMTDIPYPLEKNINEYSILVQQFDAFQKGRLDLDLDSIESLSKLKEIDNPYDLTQRLNLDLAFNDWDHAYYGGKFYSYFGVAPILTVYYPHYWLTGTLPSDAKTGMIFAFIFVFVSAILIMRLISCFKLRVNLITLCLTMFALPAASMTFVIQASADFYYLPYLSAYAFIVCFLYASITAYEYREQFKKSICWFIGAGIFIVLTVASRPPAIIPAFCLIVPLCLHILADKKLTIKQKTCYALGFAVPTIIGAILIMAYNNARFDSPFEFGTSYQLTASDIRFNKLTLGAKQIWSYLHQYWLHPLTLTEQFPFIDYNWTESYADGRYFYHGFPEFITVLSIPLNFALFAIPCVIKGKKRYQKAMFLCGFLSSVVILYIAYCVGGIHIRYIFDGLLILTLISCLTAWKLTNYFSEKQMFAAKHLINILLILSIVMGYLLIFNNERNLIRKNAPDVYLYFKNLLTLF